MLQIGIIATALWLMAGCFYLPTKNKALDEKFLPEDLIGPSGSGKPLLLHQSTRDDVQRLLPHALTWSPDGRYALYTYTVRTGYTVWPLCFSAYPDTNLKYLRLRFSPEGRLEGFDLFDDWQWAVKDTGIAVSKYRIVRHPSSAPLTPEQEQRIRNHLAARRQSETRPTSKPASPPPIKSLSG